MKRNLFAWKNWMIPILSALLLAWGTAQGEESATVSTAISADGSEIRYGVSGEGEVTLVFIHCWTCNHRFWSSQIEHFSQNHRVVWLDLAGHGDSRSQRSDYSMEAFGEDVEAVVNQVGGEKVILVGHSMGGPVAIEAAERLGDRVIGIVGVDTFYTPFEYPRSEEKIEDFVKPFKEDFKGASEGMVRSMFTPQADKDTVAWLVEQFSGANPEMGVSALYGIFRWNAEKTPAILEKYAAKLRNINAAPTGEEKALHEGVTLIPGVGHFVPQMKPDAFNEALGKIVESDSGK
ncbi:MAG: alpha/beta hydrolase [Chromatiaceae bacterium]|nr:alpha/beta hydrolase [Chromatiaceae bacterium]